MQEWWQNIPDCAADGDGHNRRMTNIQRLVLSLAATTGVLWLAGCSSTPKTPVQTGFLSSYNHLEVINPSTWRYINYDRLGSYNKFVVPAPKVLATEFKGTALTEEQKQKASAFIRKTIVDALQPTYPVVDAPGADAAEIRIALTETYKEGGRVGLVIEGEIVDTYSTVQVAAVVKSAEGEPHLMSWWERSSAKDVMTEFASRLRTVIDNGHRR